MDGEITIGTRLDTDKFDRQVTDLEKKMRKEEEKKIIIETKLGTQEQELEKAIEKTDALADAYQRLKELQDRLATGQATPKEFTTFQDLQNTYGSLEQLGASFDKALSKQDAIEQKVAQTKYRYDEINAKVSEYKQKIENVKIQKQVSDVEKLKNSFNSVGSSIQKSITNVARLALGVFGVRSAYLALRRASSDLASYDKQYAANLEYIRYALTQAIAPILRYIVNLAATLLGYINAIMQGWFGINLFSRGSAESFQKMKAGASGASKAVKEIRKQLAGFDEINMLTNQSNTGTSAGAGGVGMPNFDLSKMNGEIPLWLKWIIDNKDLILAVIAGIGSGLLAWKLGLDGIKSLGIGVLVAGLVYAFQSLLEYIKDPTWTNFGKLITGIGTAILGVGIIIAKVSGVAVGLPVIVTGVVIAIVGIIIKYWNEIQAFLQKGIDWLKDKSDIIHQRFGDTIGTIYDLFIENLQLMLDWFDNTFRNIKNILDGLIEFVKGVFTGNWRMAWEGIKKIVSSVWDWFKNTVTTVFEIAVNIIGQGTTVIKGLFNVLWSGIKAGASEAWNFVKNIFGKLANWFGSIINAVIGKFKDFGSKAGEAIGGAFKGAVNGVLRAIENILNSPIRAVNKLLDVINAVPGINLGKLNTFNLPRLKSGAILNVPNKGTLVGGGNAIAGEAGHEAYIPLTDQQAMAELGAEIGKNVVVNFTNITKVGNRQIAREIKQINANNNFAYNT